MNTRYFYILLAIWILAVAVPIGFAEILPEAYQDRQTGAEMDETVMSATAISRGLYERCLATQYSTNPVNYRVAPLTFAVTNKIGWHFDLSMRMNLDDKTKLLVPWYVDSNTVYNGTTNIPMLAVTGVWAELEIGDHTNQFTGTPAIGTNSPTYGDYPLRIYVTNLQERYKVLNALKITQSVNPVVKKVWACADTFAYDPEEGVIWIPYGDVYNLVVSEFTTNLWAGTNYPYYPQTLIAGLAFTTTFESHWHDAGWSEDGYCEVAIAAWSSKVSDPSICTQVQSSAAGFFKADFAPALYHTWYYDATNRFGDNGYELQTNAYTLITTTSNDFLFFDPHTKVAESGSDPGYPPCTSDEDTMTMEITTGFRVSDYLFLRDWQFNYCAE